MKKNIILPIAACIVLIAAAAVSISKGNANKNVSIESTDVSGRDVIINEADVTAEAAYYDYDADGTNVQLFAVKASDGTVRLALNTCQVCMGSPYAYFKQEGDSFVCQNCGNAFQTDYIGIEHGGCNPVPVTEEYYTSSNGKITVSAEFLSAYKDSFASWKKGIGDNS
ncbi:MAG: DUF2318 domain-containing protein [Clostridiales bacterium]|nr:DUF2318 domain-containing protein [Clostridiales bacterium]